MCNRPRVPDESDEPLGPARRLALLDHAERVGGLGSWEWRPAESRLLWSDNLFRLFDLAPQSRVPSPEFVVAHVHPADRTRVEDTLSALAAGERREVEYRIVRADRSVRWLRATVASIEADAGPVQLVGSVQDVTLQRRLGREIAAHVAVTEALDAWESLDEGARTLIDRLAEALNFPFGALWVRDGASLTARVIRTGDDTEALGDATARARVGIGTPTVGAAYATRQPIVAGDPADIGPDDRREAIRAAGMRSALAIPAVAGDDTLAVLEFLSPEPSSAIEGLVRTATGIGHEIGHFLSHRRGEMRAPELTARELDVLQLAARGESAEGIAAALGISRATVKRHFELAYARMGVSGRAAAVAEAMRRGWVE
ncbi:MAG: hypothetical protein QOH72_3074 [Solirubrobacteraceae bacterium]|nr:hypothetical protein [Solirubrobacteraceae bacterium]